MTVDVTSSSVTKTIRRFLLFFFKQRSRILIIYKRRSKSGFTQLGFQGRDLRQRLHGLFYSQRPLAAALFKEASLTNCWSAFPPLLLDSILLQFCAVIVDTHPLHSHCMRASFHYYTPWTTNLQITVSYIIRRSEQGPKGRGSTVVFFLLSIMVNECVYEGNFTILIETPIFWR